MTARRKKPVRARRVTAYRPWDADFASLFMAPDTWTPPDQVKLIHGKTSGTFTAVFKDERGHPMEAYARVQFSAGSIIITEQGLRASYRWSSQDSRI